MSKQLLSIDLITCIDGKWCWNGNPLNNATTALKRLRRQAKTYGARLTAARIVQTALDPISGKTGVSSLFQWSGGELPTQLL